MLKSGKDYATNCAHVPFETYRLAFISQKKRAAAGVTRLLKYSIMNCMCGKLRPSHASVTLSTSSIKIIEGLMCIEFFLNRGIFASRNYIETGQTLADEFHITEVNAALDKIIVHDCTHRNLDVILADVWCLYVNQQNRVKEGLCRFLRMVLLKDGKGHMGSK